MAERIVQKRKSPIRHCASDYVFLTINTVLLTAFLVVLAYPLLYVIIASISGGRTTLSLNLWPDSFSLEGYKAVFEFSYIWVGYRNSLVYVVCGTLLSLLVTICCAYPLSRPDFKGGQVMMVLCLITMYFGGGLIPTYLVMRDLRLLNTIWVLILPEALSVYNMIVMRTYFKTTIPTELREAADLDGCGNINFLTRIVLPLSGPIIAVIALYVAVGMWNSYFGPMIYIEDRAKQPLTIFLREILIINTLDLSATSSGTMMSTEDMANLQKRQQVMKYAVIMVASVPVMLIYPFVQKYFVKGVMIGAVKG